MENPTQLNMEAESVALIRWSFLSRLEKKVLSQKAKIHWLGVGDGNNKNFHKVATIREVRNSIREIKRADGSIVDNQEDIKKEAVEHFNNFLSHTPPDYKGVRLDELKTLLNYDCAQEDMNMLIGEVPREEVMRVLFGMAADKSPGPDGYTSEFFKTTWAPVGTLLLQ
uniref:Reverse transcriptase domain-containing protein n=1 Tax=Brassica oleracea var. oleracea TaxID=109376 RepID=A0A0D3E309_BRAOL